MKHVLLSLSLLIASTAGLMAGDPLRDLVERTTGSNAKNVKFQIDDMARGYEYHTKDGKLYITGSDNVAASRGFYDYVKNNGMGIYSWSGSNIELPKSFENGAQHEVVAPFENNYYLNVVTYGYTMPYWDWARWEQEIDWMALHGINMPLALVGYEAIMARVWKRFGLTDEEINGYFVAPGHLPWMRMGNLSGIDGPLNSDWHQDQIDLQHKILDRMRDLDMKPICMGFPGFVPQAFKRLYPDIELIQTSWAGAFHNWMLPPTEELFSQIGTAFIEEWEKEFGVNEYYLVDSFNEMEIPFPPKESNERYELLASYGDIVYNSIKDASPDATWVMQGWMFGYQRDIWDYKTLAALISEVPDDKMILLDLAVDYNKHFWHTSPNWDFHKGYTGTQWVYSVVPNMGGKTGLTGVLDFYANGHLEALASPNRGNLIAHGLAPEGIENNEVLYELYTDAGWSDKRIDVMQWYDGYQQNRYGKSDELLDKSMKSLIESVYGTFTDHPRYNWQFRPGSMQHGSINIAPSFFRGLEEFAAAAPQYKGNKLYEIDLAENTALYLGGKAEQLIQLIEQEYLLGDVERAVEYEALFEKVMMGMDSLLRNHPNLNLNHWLSYPAGKAKNSQQHEQYTQNARRLVTIWGPPIDDYSARVWGGLIEEYYLPRWKHYFEAKRTGKPFDFAKWELNWVETNPIVETVPVVDIPELSSRMIELTKGINTSSLIKRSEGDVGYWSMSEAGEREFTFQVSAKMIAKLKELKVGAIRIDGKVEVVAFELVADGEVVASSNQSKELSSSKQAVYQVGDLSGVNANNGAQLKIKIKSSGSGAGVVKL